MEAYVLHGFFVENYLPVFSSSNKQLFAILKHKDISEIASFADLVMREALRRIAQSWPAEEPNGQFFEVSIKSL